MLVEKIRVWWAHKARTCLKKLSCKYADYFVCIRFGGDYLSLFLDYICEITFKTLKYTCYTNCNIFQLTLIYNIYQGKCNNPNPIYAVN